MSKKNVCKKMLTAAMCVAMLVPSVCSESGGITVNSSELAQEKAWMKLSNVQTTVNVNELAQEKVWTQLAGSVQTSVNASELAPAKAWSQLAGSVQITVNASELAPAKAWSQLAGSVQITANACQLVQESVEATDNNSQTEQAQTTTEVSGDGMQQNETEVAAAETATEKKVINGWRRNKKKTYYYVDGKRVKGWQRIKKKTYYFNEYGVLQTNKMISKNKYVDKKGVLVDKSKIYSLGKESLSGLKKKLQNKVSSWSGTHCIYVKNLDTNEYMTINNQKMRAASLIKLYNMGTVYKQIENGSLSKTEKTTSLLNSMITVSSNDSYNLLLSTLGNGSVVSGVSKINAFCEKQNYSDTIAGGTLSPSYLKQTWLTASMTTVKDCGHIMEDIYLGTLVSEKASESMLNTLKKQQRKSKIPAGVPSGVKTANKTGEVSTRQHDVAIVFSKKSRLYYCSDDGK